LDGGDLARSRAGKRQGEDARGSVNRSEGRGRATIYLPYETRRVTVTKKQVGGMTTQRMRKKEVQGVSQRT